MMKKLVLVGAVFSVSLAMAATYLNRDPKNPIVRTTGDPDMKGFYGADNGKSAGDNSFQSCLALCESQHCLMMVIYGQTGCENACSGFAEMYHANARAVPLLLAGKVSAYYRGSSKACQDAKSFLATTLNNKGSCCMIGFYGVAEDGSQYKYTQSLPTTYSAFQKLCTEQNTSWTTFKGNHKVTATVEFANANTSLAQLQALETTKSVFVPLIRRTGTGKAEEDQLKVTYPKDGRTETIRLSWAANESRKDVEVGVAGEWVRGGSVALSLHDKSGNKLNRTSAIHFAEPVNSVDFPDLAFDPEGELGRWTLYSEANWAAVVERATTDASTNNLPTVIVKVSGGVVWNPDMVAFSSSVLGSKEYSAWCSLTGHVFSVVCDYRDPVTGASLLSHAIAANGRSGSAFLSRNGLNESACTQPPASNAFEVALYRPDGSLIGVLAPQCKDGVYDPRENALRLLDLAELAADLTEPGNNDPATTTLEAIYGQTATTEPSAPLHWVDVNDKKDVFRLVNVPAGEFVTVRALASPASRQDGREKPQVKVWRYTTDKKTATRVIDPVGQDEDGDPIWKFTADDVKLLYADVTAWTADYAATEKFNGLTDFTYPLTVTAADPYNGKVGFDVTSETYDVEPEGDGVVELQVTRTGYTGGALVRLSLDTASTTVPLDRIVWAHGANNATNLVWAAGESGTKTVSVTVRNVSWEDSVSNLVFKLSHDEGATLAEGRETCTFGIQQEDDRLAKTGVIYISDPVPTAGKKIWTKCNPGNPIEIKVMRDRVDGKARGEATAYLSVVGGAQLSTNEIKWTKGAKTGAKSVGLWLDQVGAAGQQQVVVTVRGTDVDGNDIHDAKRNTLTYVFVPTEASEFDSVPEWNACQYVAFNETAYLKDYAPAYGKIVGYELLSGKLPAGLQAEIVDNGPGVGGLRIFGSPTSADSAELVYQLVLQEVMDPTKFLRTMPVTITINVKPLGEDADGPDGETIKAVIPGFAERRVWQYLPLARKNGQDKYEVCGSLNLSASPKGSVSARYTTQGKTVAFAASALNRVFVSEDAKFGAYTAEVWMERAGFNLYVQFGTNDRVVARLTTPEGEELSFASDENIVTWKQREDRASLWKGRYTVAFEKDKASPGEQLPDAEGTAALAISMISSSMTANGVVKYTGVLPNGKPISGTSMLLTGPKDVNYVKLPIYWTSAADVFSAILVLRKTGATKSIESDDFVTSYWRSGGKGHDLSIVGASFEARDWANVKPDVKPEEKPEEKTSLILNRTSGIVSGAYKGKNFRGVALKDQKDQKFIMGTAWSAVDDGQGGVKRKAEAVKEPIVEAE